MRKGLTVREKILMCILGVLLVYLVYFYVFYTPTQAQIDHYKEEAISIDDEILLSQAKAAKLNKMKAELDELLADGSTEIKELPVYDNSRNLMNSLHFILGQAREYSITFESEIENAGIVRRDVAISYECYEYNVAKEILQKINEGEYRCLIKDVVLKNNGAGYNVTVEVTYFEYVP